MKLRAKKGEGAATFEEIEEFARGLICLTRASRRAAGRRLRPRQRLRRIAAPPATARKRRATRRWSSAPAALGIGIVATNGPWPTPRRGSAKCSTCSPACATTPRSTRRRPAAGAQFRAPREIAGAKWRACSPTCPKPSPTRTNFRPPASSPSPTSATNSRATPCREGETMASFLRQAHRRRRARGATGPITRRARRQMERELALIEKLQLDGYFLIVWDLVRFCRENGILAQGRGSAANSAVCYSLGITAVDPVGMDLLFERFLSEERGEWPDIDIDLPSGDQRERVIQYVYQRYGKLRRGHDRQRHHLPRPLGRARSGQGAGLRGRNARRALRPGPRLGVEGPRGHRRAPFPRRGLRPRATRASANFSSSTARCRTCRAISASTPAAW